MMSLLMIGCCLYSKGKNFRANHNEVVAYVAVLVAVAYIAKVRILEQITTHWHGLFSLCCCCLYSKGKNFRANHNAAADGALMCAAVAYIAKVRILEQITTALKDALYIQKLLLI